MNKIFTTILYFSEKGNFQKVTSYILLVTFRESNSLYITSSLQLHITLSKGNVTAFS